MNKLALAIAVALAASLVAGCATTTTPPPSASCQEQPPIVVPPRPTLVISTLAPDATRDELLAAYTASLYQCVGYTKELRVLLKPIKKK